MLDVKITVGGSSILASGSLVSTANQTIEFHPFPSPIDTYKISLVFKVDFAGPPSFNSVIVDNSHYSITAVNAWGPAVSSTKVPIYVANYLGRKILFHFATSTIGEGNTATRLVHYVFFDGGPVSG